MIVHVGGDDERIRRQIQLGSDAGQDGGSVDVDHLMYAIVGNALVPLPGGVSVRFGGKVLDAGQRIDHRAAVGASAYPSLIGVEETNVNCRSYSLVWVEMLLP